MATKKKVVKKTTSKKVTPSVSNTPSKVKNEASNMNVLNIILVLVVLQFLIILGMAVSMFLSGGSTIGEHGDVLEDMSQKVDNLDNFFKSNVQGYGSGSAVAVPDDSGSGGSPGSQNVGEPAIEDRPFIGDAGAPVTIVEYSDFECPFCGKFYSETYDDLKENYIETGKAKLVFKNFPLSFHQMAKPAAIAAYCVYEELGNDAFFDMHDMIFENQNSLSNAKLKEWALEVGISEDSYDSCITDDRISDIVDEDFAEGAQFGVSGTPSFIINGQLLVGAQPYNMFEQIIEAELS